MQRTSPGARPSPGRPEPFPWDDVQVFLALFRSRTMGEAARALGVNISTVSRRLSALEQALEATLFDRGRDGLVPTAAAESLLVAAEQTEAAVASFARAADALERDVSGQVRIACPPDMAEVAVLPVLRDVLHDHPALCAVVLPGEASVNLIRREADIAIRTVRPSRGDLLFRRVFTVTWVPAGSPALLERLGSVERLADLPWIGSSPEGRGSAADEWMRRQGITLRVATDGLTTQLAAAREGLGLALVPQPSVAPWGLVERPLPEPARSDLPHSEIYLVTHRTLRTVPRVKVVWEALLASFQARYSP